MDRPRRPPRSASDALVPLFRSDGPQGRGQAPSTEPDLTPPLLAAGLSALSADLTQSPACLSGRADCCLLGCGRQRAAGSPGLGPSGGLAPRPAWGGRRPLSASSWSQSVLTPPATQGRHVSFPR